MALFIRQDDNRSEFQSKLAAELQAKSKERAKSADRPDGVDDSQYIKGTKTTSSLAWVWVVIIILIIAVAIWLMALGLAQR